MKFFRLNLALMMIGLALPLAGQTERILSFDSHITVNSDASLLVKERVAVQSEGVDIRHGIYRDFPTRYKDRAGNSYAVDFEIVSLSRDGREEAYHTDDISNGVRVYFGSSNTLLEPGKYTYEFTYRTNRQLGFFDNHDELYWNATGNGWKFPIDLATATVVLPAKVRGAVTEMTGYTGYQGEKGQDFTAGRDGDGNPVFRAKDLRPHQGLTIVVSWPKGYFQPPSRQQKLAWFLHDNRSALAGLAGLAVILLYYLGVWSMVGRDPAPGTLVPLYEPPGNLSAGAMRYLEKMGFDNKVFTSAILGLAAKGNLTIRQDHAGSYHLDRKTGAGKEETKLAPEEKTLAGILFEDGDTIKLKQENHARLQRAQKALEHSLKDSMEKTLFVTNVRYLWPGVALTVVTAGAALLLSGGQGVAIGIFMSVWLSVWTLGVFALMRQTVRAWQGVRAQGPLAIIPALFTSLFTIPFLGGEVFGIAILGASVGVVVLLILFCAIGSNVLFHYLLKAPTRAGRQVLDRVEGFKMFLGAVDGDRLNRMSPVAKTPELFERFLPYALALGVEHAWAQQFVQVLAAAAGSQGQGGSPGYVPTWYSGTGLTSFSPPDFASSFSSSFSSAVSSASTSPGSSSGSGGGGSSGGGGGGGGGGGW
jgi:uncharacterized membrane protein YgcG